MASRNTLPGWQATLILISFAIHSALLVNSVEAELWRQQGKEGDMLVQQLADAAAPAALGRDMVSLSVLTARYDNRPGIASVHIYNAENEQLAQAGRQGALEGRSFSAPLRLEGQVAGHVDLTLSVPARGDILRRSAGNIGLSGLLHLLLLAGWFWTGSRPREERQTAPRPIHATAATEPQTRPTTTKPATLLHLTLDDPNQLLLRVNASTADELLTVLDHLLDRAARLYGGEVTSPFSPQGTVVLFRQEKAAERCFQALMCGQLFLQLAEMAAEQRREASLFTLPVKGGVHHATEDNADQRQIAHLLAVTAPGSRLLSGSQGLDPQALAHCQGGQKLSLALADGSELPIIVIERLSPEYQQLIHNQSLQLLGAAS